MERNINSSGDVAIGGASPTSTLSHSRPVRPPASKAVVERVSKVLDTLRPIVQSDGGDIELLAVDVGGLVRVRLLGACIGCPSSTMTLTLGIERNLKSQVPEVTGVVCE